MDSKKVERIVEVLDVDRTNELFEAGITRSDALSTEQFNESNLKGFKAALGAGNLHVNTARAKMSAIRLVGYRDSLAAMKGAIKKKVRSSLK